MIAPTKKTMQAIAAHFLRLEASASHPFIKVPTQTPSCRLEVERSWAALSSTVKPLVA